MLTHFLNLNFTKKHLFHYYNGKAASLRLIEDLYISTYEIMWDEEYVNLLDRSNHLITCIKMYCRPSIQ